MGRIPIDSRLLYSRIHVHPGNHRELIPLSEGYARAVGRLDTRYSPVRRSPAAYCYAPMPLDLHVLSL